MKFDLKIESINYVKILYKDDNDFLHCVKASLKTLNEYDIYTCIKKDEWEKVPFPQDITISFACFDGLYKADTTLKYVRYEEPFLYFSIKPPEEVKYQQEREFFRVNINIPAVVSYKIDEFIERIQCKTFDLSANGIKIKLEDEKYFPEEVSIDLYFEKRVIRTNAKYMRTDTEDDIITAAFNFIDLSENDTDYLSQICIRKQIEDKRHSLK